MKHLWKNLFILILVVVIITGCSPTTPQQKEGPSSVASLNIGVAAAVVNPKDGTLLGGYDMNRGAKGVHDNLYAKTVVFSYGENAVALIIVDSIGLQYDTIQEIRAAAAKATTAISIPPEQVIVASTHTHGSPDTLGVYGPDQQTTGRDEAYMKQLINTCAGIVAKAADNLLPATLAYAECQGPDWAVNDSEPGELDRTVSILQCLDASGASLATLTGFACHPTVLDGDNAQITSDWVGAFYEHMEAAMPGEHLFIQGGVGGWVQPETPERSFKLAATYGNDLGAKVLAALESTTPLTGSEVRFANTVFDMPNENPGFKQLSEMGVLPRGIGDTVETEVAWFAVGEAQFATHPGETAPAFTFATKEMMDSGPKFVLGIGLDHLGYIVKPEYFDRPDEIPHAPYLTRMSLGQQTGPKMMEALAATIP